MTTERHWCIYGLKDSPDEPYREGFVRYIGKSDDPYRRVKEHCVDALNRWMQFEDELDAVKALPGYGTAEDVEPPSDYTRWLAMQWKECRLPEVIILESGRGDGWREREKHWIKVAKDLGLILFNRTNGG